MAANLVRHPSKRILSVKPESGGGLRLLRHVTPLTRRHVVYFCSGARRIHYGRLVVPDLNLECTELYQRNVSEMLNEVVVDLVRVSAAMRMAPCILAQRRFHAVVGDNGSCDVYNCAVSLTTQAHGACRSLSMKRSHFLLILCLLPLAMQYQAQAAQTSQTHHSTGVEP